MSHVEQLMKCGISCGRTWGSHHIYIYNIYKMHAPQSGSTWKLVLDNSKSNYQMVAHLVLANVDADRLAHGSRRFCLLKTNARSTPCDVAASGTNPGAEVTETSNVDGKQHSRPVTCKQGLFVGIFPTATFGA